jgi:hypothetical protein
MQFVEPQLCDTIQQLASPDEDVVEGLGIDVRGLYPLNSHNWGIVNRDVENAWEYTDEWGITHRRLKPDGLYYSVVRSPLSQSTITLADISVIPPWTSNPERIAGLRTSAAHHAQGKAVMIKGVLAGIFEMSQRVRAWKIF